MSDNQKPEPSTELDTEKPEAEATLDQEIERLADHAPKTAALLRKAAKYFGNV